MDIKCIITQNKLIGLILEILWRFFWYEAIRKIKYRDIQCYIKMRSHEMNTLYYQSLSEKDRIKYGIKINRLLQEQHLPEYSKYRQNHCLCVGERCIGDRSVAIIVFPCNLTFRLVRSFTDRLNKAVCV